jgi:hypothetical protein
MPTIKLARVVSRIGAICGLVSFMASSLVGEWGKAVMSAVAFAFNVYFAFLFSSMEDDT